MKVTNWRRKLAASLVAGGLLAPCAVQGANLDTNLVTNPGFEDVDVNTTCCYLSAAVKINSWSNGSLTGFAYNNELVKLDGSGNIGWDDGGPLAGGGKYFFGPASGTDAVNYQSVTSPGLVSQNLDVSTGPTGGLIATGAAAVVLSGFFTSYNGQNDRFGTMQVDFLNAGGTSLGSTLITSALDPNPWHKERKATVIPVGTATLRASLYGNNFNAYIDNVDVRVLNAADAAIFGDLNSDGNVNSLDWVILRTNQETDLSGLTVEQSYRRGDLNGDLANNQPDFIAFKTAFEDFNGGAGSFATMLAGLPEPSTIVLIFAAGLFVLPVRRRATNCESS
jgi:Dockerin type I domain